MMRLVLALIFMGCIGGVMAQLNMELLSTFPVEGEGNDIWGYTAPDGNEYAIIGSTAGVYVINITDTRNPVEVQFIAQQYSIWRDIKTWGSYAYVVADQGNSTDGILIIDLANLPSSVTWENQNPAIEQNGPVEHCHNIFIDEFGFAYLSGCDNYDGVSIWDVGSTPGQPILAGLCPDIYSHDVYVRDNLVYSSEIYAGHFAIYDVTNKDDIGLVATQTTPFSFTHNAWLSDDGNVIFTTDERANAPVAAYDISDPSDIKFLDQFRPRATAGDGVIPHNVHVWDDWLIISYYSDGCIIVDASRPDNLLEVGNFDTFLGAGAGFSGAWGAYPFFPSQSVIVSDIEAGLFVLQPTYTRACWLEGAVTDKETGEPIVNAKIEIVELEVEEYTRFNSEYKTGTGVPGTYTVTCSASKYESQTRQVILENGVLSLEDFELEKLPFISIGGKVVDKDTGLPVEDAKVNLLLNGLVTGIRSDADGLFTFAGQQITETDISCGKWGYKTTLLGSTPLDINNPSPYFEIELEQGYEDIFSIDLGWTTTFEGDRGGWTRVKPIGTLLPSVGLYMNPDTDSDDRGDRAYVTGQSEDLVFSLLLGESTLECPEFDVSDMTNPVISFDYWLWAIEIQGLANTDNAIELTLYNGIDSAIVDAISYDELKEVVWEQSPLIVLKDYLDITPNMSFKVFIKNDDDQRFVEAGIDNFRIIELESVANDNLALDNKLNVFPNPSGQFFNLEIPREMRDAGGMMDLTVYSFSGELVTHRTLPFYEEIVSFGQSYSPGVYIVVMRDEQGRAYSVKLVKE